ncbi:hypothetical protein [Chondromyces apiculatus]|uniref:Beta-lactamase n=1 Tax=Chondromyces apiculatus DSM 436 TaxID=1192034 RepID=A0A017T9M0_9BACT|nr:hypothetical protein [Chondromyces apiculatus]EYF05968.1 Hypothetical protein CAP_2427 [Chondromyces apiculatus DSM 436]
MLRPHRAIPALAFPFALVGLAAGWLSSGALAVPLIGYSNHPRRGMAALLAMAVGAGVGAALTWRCVRSPEERVGGQLLASVLVGGALTGGVVGSAEAGLARGMPAGVVAGVLTGLAFFPVCSVVVGAARRAVRARLGSIVAGSDARAVWSILATALSLATLVALPEWAGALLAKAPRHILDRVWEAERPYVAASVALGAVLLIATILVADLVALRGVRRVMQTHLEPHEPRPGESGGEVPALDLGLGEETQAQLARGGSAYRSQPRAVALLVGSADQAREALRRAIARGAAGLVAGGLVLGTHAWAAVGGGSQTYAEARCAQDSASGCVHAARGYLASAPVSDADVAHARELLRRACARADAAGCAELSRLLESSSLETEDFEWAATTACLMGVSERCRTVASALRNKTPERALSFFRLGCGYGDTASCHLIEEVERAAHARTVR